MALNWNFLTKLNRQGLSCVKLGSTGIYAESISYVEIFSGNYIEVKHWNMPIKIASPASYVLQKLIINERRGDKREKDIQSVKYVLEYIKSSRKYYTEFLTLYDSLPKTWKKQIDKVAKANEINL